MPDRKQIRAKSLLFCVVSCLAVLFSQFYVTGCGGAGTRGTPPPAIALVRSAVNVTVAPPAGVAMPTTVSTALGSANVDGGQANNTPIFNEGPQFAFATDPAGNVVLMGFVGPASPTLNSRTTAEALVFFAASAYLLPNGPRSQVFDLLKTDDHIDPVVQAIETALASDPAALSNGNASIKAAVATAAAGLISGSRGILIQNPGSDSGITVTQDGLNAINLRNDFRRRAHYFVERVSYVPEGGGAPIPSPADVSEGDISPTVGVTSVFGSITDILVGNMAYTGVDTGTIDLPIQPTNAASTLYKVRVVGIGISAGDEDTLSGPQTSKKRELILKSFVVDFFIPFLANVVMPIKGDQIDDMLNLTHGEDLASALVSIIGSAAPSALEKAEQGNVADALLDLFNNVATNGQVRVSILQALFDGFTAKFNFPYNSLQEFTKAGELALKVLDVGDTILVAFDSLIQARHIDQSKRAYSWDIVSTRSPVNLNPASAEIGLDETQIFTAVVPDATGSEVALAYRWSCTGAHGGISDGIHTGTSFDSSQAFVSYVPSTEGSDTITVEAFEVRGQERISLGTATSQVTVESEDNPYILESFVVDDNMTLWLNGEEIFRDADGNFAGSRGPFTLTGAKAGDTIRIQVRDWYGHFAGISDIYIKRPNGTRRLWLPAQNTATAAGSHDVIVDATTTLD